MSWRWWIYIDIDGLLACPLPKSVRCGLSRFFYVLLLMETLSTRSCLYLFGVFVSNLWFVFAVFFLLWLIFEYWLFRWFNAFEAGLGCKATIIVLQDLDLKTSDPPSTKPIFILVGYLIGILKNLVWEKWRSLCHGLWNNIYTNWVVFHPFSLPKKSSNWSLGTAEFWRPEVKYRNACREPAKRWFL